jgi:hypothetical protein
VPWLVLAGVVVVVHFAYLAFVAFGGFLTWRSPKWVAPHLAALAAALISVTVHYDCPLTNVEDWLERRDGKHPSGQFIDRYVKGYLVPHGHDGLVQLAIALLIVVAYAGFFWRRRTRGRTRTNVKLA